MGAEEAMALALIDEARLLLRAGQADRALWRLVDAAGLASRAVKEKQGVAGIDEPTGRGFLLLDQSRDVIAVDEEDETR